MLPLMDTFGLVALLFYVLIDFNRSYLYFRLGLFKFIVSSKVLVRLYLVYCVSHHQFWQGISFRCLRILVIVDIMIGLLFLVNGFLWLLLLKGFVNCLLFLSIFNLCLFVWIIVELVSMVDSMDWVGFVINTVIILNWVERILRRFFVIVLEGWAWQLSLDGLFLLLILNATLFS